MRQLFGGRTECEYQARVCNRCNYMVRQYPRLNRSRDECSSGMRWWFLFCKTILDSDKCGEIFRTSRAVPLLQ